jgi:phage shock protein A
MELAERKGRCPVAAYQSIFDKVGILISANVNALLDRALSGNSVAVFDEYINRMNGALDGLETAEGVERGRVKTLGRQIEETESDATRLDDDVDRLLGKGERTLAAARQAVLNTKKNLLESLQADLQNAQGEVSKLGDARAKLSAQIEVTKAKRGELVGLLEQRKAAEMRLKAQRGIHVAAPGTFRTDEIIEKERQRVEMVEGQNEAAAATLDHRIDDLLGSDEIEDQLKEREAKLLGRNQVKELPEKA